MNPNYEASWDFLQQFHPGRLIVVTGVSLDKKSIPTETFSPDEREKFLRWVAACGKMPANIYFSVGEPMARATKKLERTDIKTVHWLHVDVDPKTGEDIDAERARILAMLREPPGGVPKPTCVVYSGGGYQAYWRLSEPIAINGDMEAAEDAKLYNLQIERLLGADNCHNVDRIMRVPGTINMPDAKKQKKGRTPALSELVDWNDDRVYSISQFVKAPIVQPTGGVATGAGIGSAPSIRAPSNIKRLAHVDELGKQVRDSVKVYIVQGCNPDDPDFFPSRSEMLFWVTCELVRSGIDADTIYSVLTDKEFKISESVLEKGNGAERYALRQIERAKEQAIDPLLCELNDRHAVIENYGGRCVVIEEIMDDILNRSSLSRQGFDHFRNRYMNRMVVVGQKTVKGVGTVDQEMPAGEWWLRHSQRRQYSRIVFVPGKDVAGAYNLWRGFGCEARPGDCGLFLAHLREIVCGGVEEYYLYLLAWMASAVQRPSEQGGSAVVLQGHQGCGKSIVPEFFGMLFGRHYLSVSKPEHLVGNFNAHLRDCVLLFADEAFFAGDKRNESVLKTLITQRTLTIEAKGIDVEQSANCTHLIMASNDKWVVPAGADDRRYFVLRCKSDRVGDRDYFDAMADQWKEQGGKEAFLHFLLTYDIAASGVDLRNVPKTEALRQQKVMSMDSDAEWWMNILKRGTLLPEHADWTGLVACELLVLDYLNYARSFNIGRRGNSTRMGMSLNEMVPDLKRQQRMSPVDIPQADGTIRTVARPYFYRLPSLEDCRAHFDAKYGGPYNWEGDMPLEEMPDYANVFE